MSNIFGQTSAGAKPISDRYIQYPSAPYVQEAYNPHYAYDAAPAQYVPNHGITTKHSHHGGHKSHAAMSALTLLAFLFFLHILQQCLKDHMTSMNTPSIMIMTGGRDGEDVNLAKTDDVHVAKTDIKKDKSGQIDRQDKSKADKPTGAQSVLKVTKPAGAQSVSKVNKPPGSASQYVPKAQEPPDFFTKVKLSHHENRHKNNAIKGFVSAMTVD